MVTQHKCACDTSVGFSNVIISEEMDHATNTPSSGSLLAHAILSLKQWQMRFLVQRLGELDGPRWPRAK